MEIMDIIEGSIHKTKTSGHLKIVRYITSREVLVEFVDTGFKLMSKSSDIRTGLIKDPTSPSVFNVGFFGVGPYKAKITGRMTSAYTAWHGMMSRCYSLDSHKLNPTYKDCTVCDEWHNFQIFAEWFYINYKNCYELDKDIINHGNRIYSPDNCKFVTKSENTIYSSKIKYKLMSPDGRIYEGGNITEFSSKHGLSRSAVGLVLKGKSRQHKGWTKA